jgi:adenylate cyclase
MKDEQLNRKLTAILSADAKGYSRLMGHDDVATVQTLKHCHEIMNAEIQRHHGRVIDFPGDNLLAEFASIVDAVKCALVIQECLSQYASDLPDDRKMPFRIGVNMGDVIVDGERIYGDGVNIAARLESLADAGGICLSSSAYDQIQNKLAFGGEYIGEQLVKNIETPIKVYKIWSDPEADGRIDTQRTISRTRWRWPAIAAILIVVVAGAAFYAWQGYQNREPAAETTQLEQQPSTTSSDKPSIAVLPFSNLSDDKEQEYFSDGITNDIITDLSKFSVLSVAASNTVFKYKGKPVDIREVGRELNVAYVLECSIQKAADRVRINTQLLDASNGNHIWPDRFIRKTADIFKLQDEIIENIVRKLALKINQTERERVFSEQTDNLEAYDYLLKAYHHFYQRKREGSLKATEYFKKAIELDPNYSDACAGLAHVPRWVAGYGWTKFPDLAMQQAEELLEKAIMLDESNAFARAQLGYIYMRKGEYDLVISEMKRSIELNPNDWRTYRLHAPVLLYSGKPDDAPYWYNMSLKYDPYVSPGTFMNIGIANFLKGHNDEALSWLNKCAARWPTFLGNHIVLAAVHGHMDNLEEARKETQEVLSIAPFFEVDFYGEAYHNPEHRRKIVEGLRKAGIK